MRVMGTLPALRADADALRAFWRALVRPGDVHEARAPKTRGRWHGALSGYFNAGEAFVSALSHVTGDEAEAVYLTLNPVNPALLARAANRLKENARETTSDADIVKRATLLIDFDPMRPSGISSTDAERDAALALRDIVRAYLTDEAGWPEPLAVTMSGNGAGLLYRVDLPNDGEATALVEHVLKALAHLFDSDAVKVDTANYNAARITKIIGTVAAKGDNTPERPWRRAKAMFTPDAPPVSRETLERVSAFAPEPEQHKTRASGDGAGERRWDLRDLLTRAGIGWQERAKAGYTILQLDRCLTSQDHTDGAALFEFASGAVAYRCLHNRCGGRRWEDARAVLVPDGAVEGKKSRRGKREEKPKQPLPPELAGRRIHPALDFDSDGFAVVGILDGAAWRTITSDRVEYQTEALADILTPGPATYPALGERWAAEARAAYLKGDAAAPSWAATVATLLQVFREYVEFDEDLPYAVLALWTLGTYFFPTLPSFPRLNLHGEKGSGKSKTLKLTGALAHNGLWRTAPRAAPLFRLIEALRPTLCLDELEHLDREDRGDIAAILNAGYQAGGAVDRCDPVTFNVRPFAVYAPVALAGIKGLNAVLADRCVTLIMQPGRDRERVNRDVDLSNPDPRFNMIRDLAYRLALTRWRDVRAAWERLDLPAWLNGRSRELWAPLLALADLVATEVPRLDLRPALTALARPDAEDRAELPEVAAAILAALEKKLREAEPVTIQPGELTGDLKAVLGYDVTPNLVGLRLKALGFKRDRGRKGGSWYTVSAEAIREIRERRELADEPTPADPPGT